MMVGRMISTPYRNNPYFSIAEELVAELLPEAAQDASAVLPDSGC